MSRKQKFIPECGNGLQEKIFLSMDAIHSELLYTGNKTRVCLKTYTSFERKRRGLHGTVIIV